MLQDVASIVIMAYMKIIHIYLRSIYFPKTRSENDAWCVEKQTITVNRLREKWSQKKATPPSTILFQISSEVERLFLFLTAMKNVTAKRVTICQHEIHVIQQIAPENIQITPNNIQKTPENIQKNKSCLFRQSWPHVRNKPSSDSLAGHIRRGTIGTKTSCPGTQRNTNTKSIWRTWFVTILARECTWQNSLLSKP